jgi:GDP-L-fucose synthase
VSLVSEGRIYVAGHAGLVGGAITKRLMAEGGNPILRPSADLDLTESDAVERFFAAERPDCVFLAAAKVGGILANDTYPGDFIRENLAIQLNVLDAARRHGVKKLLFLGSSCIYPKHAPQPMREEHLLTGPLESTNRPYAIAKIAGIEMCQSYWRQYGCRFVSAMPTNVYGPGDNFDLETSHVLPALIRKFHEAKKTRAESVVLWGSGTPRREFLHVDDLADACLFLMEHWERPDIVNVGVGEDLSIAELAALIRDVVGFEGGIVYDDSKPDGAPRKLMDVTRLTAAGWRAKISLDGGIRDTYQWFLENHA